MPETIKGEIKIDEKENKTAKEKIKDILSFRKTVSAAFNKEVSDFLKIALAGAINLNASDIHLEPEKENVKLRLRIDGMLHDVLFIGLDLYEKVLSRLKLLSGIKLNITDQAQDGRFTVFLGDVPIETRVATLPSEYGESTALRILNPKSLIEIEELGVRDDMQEVFKKEIKRPNGMIIVTGPTGSGKTTTLYAVLKEIQKPEIKIITIEDPIEYHLTGITQTQVEPEKGYNFDNGLQAIVRQDPDVILVGEIRDSLTAKIALQAALTGHLVLTTLHTNDAAGTVARLKTLKETPANIVAAVKLAIGQRLVRKVCSSCSKMEKANSKELAFFKKELNGLKIKIPALDKNLKIPRVKGCKYCNFTGYRGRAGVYEFFLVDSEMENFILKSPSISDLRKFSQKKGMVTMKQDGMIKVLQGQTTIEEVERVCG